MRMYMYMYIRVFARVCACVCVCVCVRARLLRGSGQHTAARIEIVEKCDANRHVQRHSNVPAVEIRVRGRVSPARTHLTQQRGALL